MQARQIYDALVVAIDVACEERGFLEVCDEAIRLGMAGGQTGDIMTLGYKYEYTDEESQVVSLYVRSYDPSGPFQNEPDINRFTAKLHTNGREVASHDRSYTD